jgi:hypothetical protein
VSSPALAPFRQPSSVTRHNRNAWSCQLCNQRCAPLMMISRYKPNKYQNINALIIRLTPEKLRRKIVSCEKAFHGNPAEVR